MLHSLAAASPVHKMGACAAGPACLAYTLTAMLLIVWVQLVLRRPVTPSLPPCLLCTCCPSHTIRRAPAAAADNAGILPLTGAKDCPISPCSTIRCAAVQSGTVQCVDDLASCTGKCVVKPFPRCKTSANLAWDSTVNACVACGVGFVADAKLNRCVPCPVNTYVVNSAAGRQCVKCPAGKTTQGKQGQVRCV